MYTIADGDFKDKGRLFTKTLIDHVYTLEKMKIYFRKFYGRYYELLQHYNTSLSQFLCDQSSVDMRYINRIWRHLIWLVILLIPRRLRGHIGWTLLLLGTYSHTLVFLRIRAVFGATFASGIVMFMD